MDESAPSGLPAYFAAWHALYWVVHGAALLLFPWYREQSAESRDYHVKKLGLAKLDPESQAQRARSYYRNYFVTCALAAVHGLVMGYLLVPFVLANPRFLLDATIAKTAEDPAGSSNAHAPLLPDLAPRYFKPRPLILRFF